jgi:hypothetical protein
MDLNFNSTYIVPYCTTKQIPIEAPIFAVGGSQREDARKKVPPECALSAEADLYACNARLLQPLDPGKVRRYSMIF